MEDFSMDDDDLMEDLMIIAVTADAETWLPQIMVGLPVDTDNIVEGIAPLSLTPEEAYQVGAYLIQAASTVASFYTELIDKSVEERKEIMDLESQLLGSSFPSEL